MGGKAKKDFEELECRYASHEFESSMPSNFQPQKHAIYPRLRASFSRREVHARKLSNSHRELQRKLNTSLFLSVSAGFPE
jgi:hypothetical protein